MGEKLTAIYIKNLKAPAKGRLVIADTETRGLSLRVTEKGVKSWLVRYRVKGEKATDEKGRRIQRYCVLAEIGSLSLADARAEAGEIILAAKKGRDLVATRRAEQAAEEKAERAARTVRQVVEEYIEKVVKPHQRTWYDTELRLKNHVLPTLGERDIRTITRGDISQLLDHLEHVKGLTKQVNLVRSTLRSMFKFAIEREYREDDPAGGTSHRRKLDVSRERTLTNDEIKAVWIAAGELPVLGKVLVRSLFLTACRLNEIRMAAPSEISESLFVIPGSRAKTGRDHVVPLVDEAVALFGELPRVSKQFLFSTNGVAAWAGHTRTKTALDEACGVKDWTYHDIRRTVRTKMAELRIPDAIAERCIAHAVGTSVSRTYDRHEYLAEKTEAFQTWTNCLMAIVGEAPDNVAQFQRRA